MRYSKLAQCDVVHTRYQPIKRTFRYQQMMICLDLDERITLDQWKPWFGIHRYYPLSFIESDHYTGLGQDLKQAVLDYVKLQAPYLSVERVLLLTNPRSWGHHFNPISTYLLLDTTDQCVGALYEVGNTFGEQKLFFSAGLTAQAPKHFYVSPYIPLETQFHFALAYSPEAIHLRITSEGDEGLVLAATLQVKLLPWTRQNLRQMIWRYPFNSLKVLRAIHWQALLLWFQRLPWIKKQEHPELQQGILDGKKIKRSPKTET